MNYHDYKNCIDACLQCAAICQHCASMDLKEEDAKMMSRCVQLDMECALLCTAAAHLMSIGSERAVAICRICAEICQACGDECSRHDHAHCRECAQACYACAKECQAMQK